MRGGAFIFAGLVVASSAPAAKDGPPADKVVEQFFKAWVGRKLQPLKRLLDKPETAESLFGADESWFELPPFKKAWAGQQAQVGAPTGEGDAVTVPVTLLTLDLGPLAAVTQEIETALAALPEPQRDKRRKPLLLQALRQVKWTYQSRELAVACARQDGRWRITATGLVSPSPAVVEPPPPPPAPVEEEEATSGGFRVSKADLAAYPAALKVLSVEGQELDNAFRGKVIASVRNQGRLAIRGVRATVVYQTGSKEVRDANRSFVAPAKVICPGASGQLETEALPPADRGKPERLILQDVVVEIDRPDAFGRLASAVCESR